MNAWERAQDVVYSLMRRGNHLWESDTRIIAVAIEKAATDERVACILRLLEAANHISESDSIGAEWLRHAAELVRGAK